MTTARLPRPCAEPGCPELVRDGPRCREHTREQWVNYDAGRLTSHRRGYTRQWSKYRKRFLSEHPYCRHCKAEGRTEMATELDHIEPVAGADDPLFWDPTNHQGLCRSHHARKTARERRGRKQLSRRRDVPDRRWTFA